MGTAAPGNGSNANEAAEAASFFMDCREAA
jgi:hypothetical protein